MTFRHPEEELKEFLAQYPRWMEEILWKAPSPANLRLYPGVVEKYESILERIPEKYREYCQAKMKHLKRELLSVAPSGRPRKDALAEEARQLRAEGKSYARTASELNRRHGQGTTTPENIRALLKSRKSVSTPDKT